jgi:hypothetical protein
MGRYNDGQEEGGDAPKETKIIKETLDADSIADAVAKALEGKLGRNVSFGGGSESGGSATDTFDSKSTMKALADSMTVQRGDSESNFEDLGNVKETKKDKKAIDDAIDFLKDVDDENL